MTDNAGNQIGTTVKYLPFGETRANVTVPTDKLFTGQRLDGTGLYYYNARYYDPAIGRFISADTVIPNMANPQCFNRYSYCLNNPLKYTDPSGHGSETNSETSSTSINYSASGQITVTISYTTTIKVYSNVPNPDVMDELMENMTFAAGYGGIAAGFSTLMSLYISTANPKYLVATEVISSKVVITKSDSMTTVSIGVGVGIHSSIAPNSGVNMHCTSTIPFNPNITPGDINKNTGPSISPQNYSNSLDPVISLRPTQCQDYCRDSYGGFINMPSNLDPLSVDIGFHLTNSSPDFWMDTRNFHFDITNGTVTTS
jgi:RHS repeat-associated protein